VLPCRWPSTACFPRPDEWRRIGPEWPARELWRVTSDRSAQEMSSPNPDAIDITVSHQGRRATHERIPDFPWVRLHTGHVAYEEALIQGQYLVVNWSAMGRPNERERIWKTFADGADSWRPLRSRQHAFFLEVDGQRLGDRWSWVTSSEVDPRPTSGRELVVDLRHAVRPITVKVHTALDGTAFLVRWLEITNTGDRPAAISDVYPWSGMLWSVGDGRDSPRTNETPFSVGRFRNAEPLVEGQFDWEVLPDGGFHIENVRGVSGHGCPFFVLRNDATGENVIAHFEYSGNWQIEAYNDHEPGLPPSLPARLYLRVGLAGPAPLRVLEPGETARTPAVHLAHYYGDLDDGVQELHRHVRTSVAPTQRVEPQHPVTCNHTGYTWNAQITEEQLLGEIDVAADVGAELFIVDAGWYGDESGQWPTQVGDWYETPLLPRGLKPIFDHARERRMMVGLWTEIERVGRESKARRAHLNWLMKRRGETIEQLDLAKPEVATYVEETIIRLIDQFQLDCFRLDYNIRIGEGAEAERDGFVETTAWRYYDALYGVFDRVRKRFPRLLLENCAAGGGRTDLGMLRRFHWTQITDNWSPARTLKILNGASLALPPEQCMTLLGAISLGTADLDFMLRVGLFGHFCISGIFPSTEEVHQVARERWRHTIDRYKRFTRPSLSTCRVFHHTPIQRHNEPGEWCVLEHAAPDGSRAYVGVFRLAGSATPDYRLVPRGLDATRRYRVTFDNTNQAFEVDGHVLADTGCHVRVPGILQSELVLFEAASPSR